MTLVFTLNLDRLTSRLVAVMIPLVMIIRPSDLYNVSTRLSRLNPATRPIFQITDTTPRPCHIDFRIFPILTNVLSYRFRCATYFIITDGRCARSLQEISFTLLLSRRNKYRQKPNSGDSRDSCVQ